MRKIFYNSVATEETYALIREQLPPGFELVTLTAEDDEQRREKIASCEVAIVAATPLRGDVIAAGKNLRLVHHQGVGYHDTVDVKALVERGIVLALTPAGTTLSVAEHTVMLILAACRRVAFADAELRQGRWHINSLRPFSYELNGKTVGYLGMGRIGQATAARLKAFDTTGIYHDTNDLLDEEQRAVLGLRSVSFDELLAASDVLTIHVPGTPATRGLVDAAAIGRMKRTAVLVNTARGHIVDNAALADALTSGRIAAAGLDVFEREPVSADNPLVALPNVVLTPHISAGTREALERKMVALFSNVRRFFESGELEHRVDLGTGA